MSDQKKYRFLFIQPFRIPKSSDYLTWTVEGTREERLMNYENLQLGRLLDDVEWEIHPGPLAPYGDWPVENREEFDLVAAARLPVVKEACESGRWNAIILLGGGEPGCFGLARDRQTLRDTGDFLCHFADARGVHAGVQVHDHRSGR